MIKAGIIGGAGYTAGELIRLLLNHPDVELAFVQSASHAGAKLSDVHSGIEGDTDLTFVEKGDLKQTDVLFLCMAHGESDRFWGANSRPSGLKVIDLAQDYRDEHDGFVYGLPELNKERIKGADSIANPGCFATAIQLSLLPLAAGRHLVEGSEINITAITGSTGAGVKPGPTTHFSWRDNNLSVYKPFTHQHLKEIGMNLERLQPGHDTKINFIPMRGDFPRGIFSNILIDSGLSHKEIVKVFENYYDGSPFVRIHEKPIDLKQVVNTNKAAIHLETHDGKVLITCAIDNLLKGASGQALHNMNLVFGIDEKEGLKLKPSAF